MDEMLWPTTFNGKGVRWTLSFKMSNLQYNQWEPG